MLVVEVASLCAGAHDDIVPGTRRFDSALGAPPCHHDHIRGCRAFYNFIPANGTLATPAEHGDGLPCEPATECRGILQAFRLDTRETAGASGPALDWYFITTKMDKGPGEEACSFGEHVSNKIENFIVASA